MEPRSAPPLAFDGNGDREYLMGLSITDLISNLRTAFRMADYDHVEEVLVEKEAKLKAEIKALTEKLELETLVRMNVEDELKKCKEQCEERKNAEERYERLLESVKKNNDLDLENTVAELRIKNAKLEAENRRAESVVESWKRKFEEFCERLLIVEKGTNSFVDGDTLVGTRGKAEELSGIRGNTDPVVSDKVTGEKDGVDICDNERGNTNAVTGQSSESPNNAVLGASEKKHSSLFCTNASVNGFVLKTWTNRKRIELICITMSLEILLQTLLHLKERKIKMIVEITISQLMIVLDNPHTLQNQLMQVRDHKK
ncbi:uncharacterized protein LOC129303243 isoform X2 [Prosopis cineraria]|uniref:uncharacterized protein LOC129303243 isoform X2 n=1 Tax=Prosopis cineraria TaxID=364024 RepID=UPI00240F8458|nr:uncharacterized protein LOC129303243 isoform X2 [Prosopis cineraria]